MKGKVGHGGKGEIGGTGRERRNRWDMQGMVGIGGTVD